MALSGNFEKKFAGGSSGGYYVGIDWKVNSQSASSNSSNVTATVYLRTSGNGYSISSSASKSLSLVIDGTSYSSTTTVGIGTNTKKNLFSKTVTVKHSSDGSKTCAFSTSVGVNVTLSGSYISTVTVNGNGTFDKINLNSAPVLSGSVSLSPNGTISENQKTLSVTWNGASDSNGNLSGYRVYRYVNGSHNGTYWQGTPSLNDDISGFGQGTTFKYEVWAYDSQSAYSGMISSPTVTKNKFVGASIKSFSSNITWGATSITANIGGASNTTGNTDFTYRLQCDDVTIYNQRDTKNTTETLSIWNGQGTAPSTPYLKLEDLKNKFKNDSYKGNIRIILKTTNAYGSNATSTSSLSVDLRVAPVKPSSVTINGGTALKTIPSTGNKYYIPNGSDTIQVTWQGGSDQLGGEYKYKIYQILDGVTKELGTVNSNVKSHTVVLDKQSTTKQLAFRVCTVSSFGYEDYRDSSAVTLHHYSNPSINVENIVRTDTSATATISIKANTSIPNVNFTTRTYSGASSGTLQNKQTPQNITATNLKGGNTYNWKISIVDDTGLQSGTVVETINIPSYTPLFSVREKGVGINVIPNGTYDLHVVGKANVDGELLVNGKKVGADVNWNSTPSINSTGTITAKDFKVSTDPNAKTSLGYETSTGDTYISNSDNGWLRLKKDKTMTYCGNKVYTSNNKPTASEVGALPLSGGTLTGSLTTFAPPSMNMASLRATTQGDGNASGDGNTHLGYKDSNGNYNHYFRGKGTTIVDTHGGLSVANNINVSGAVFSNGNISVGSNADNYRCLVAKRTSSGINYQAQYAVNYVNSVKLSSSASAFMAYGAMIECVRDGSAQRRVILAQNCFIPASDNNTYLGASSHRWQSIYASTGTVYSSSREEKYDIEPVQTPSVFCNKGARSTETTKDIILNGLKNANLYSYKYRSLKDDNSTFVGFIGQELEEDSNEFFNLIGSSYVNDKEEVQYDIRESSLVGALWVGVQSALLDNETLKEENEQLRKENEELKTRLEKIEKMLGI